MYFIDQHLDSNYNLTEGIPFSLNYFDMQNWPLSRVFLVAMTYLKKIIKLLSNEL